MSDDKEKPASMADAIANIRDLASQVGLSEKPPIDEERIERFYPEERKPTNGHRELKELDERGRRVVELIVFGIDESERELANRLGVPLHEGLKPEMACDVAGLRRKNGRRFMEDPLVKREIARLTKAMLDGAIPMAARRLIGLADQPIDATAAAASVQLKAVALLLGDRVGPTRPGVNVHVNVENHIKPLAAGLVIRLPQSVQAAPLEKQQPPMIEAQTNHPAPATIDAEAIEEDFLSDTVRRNPRITEG